MANQETPTTLNGKPVSEEQLREAQEQASQQKGVKIEEVKKNTFRRKLED